MNLKLSAHQVKDLKRRLVRKEKARVKSELIVKLRKEAEMRSVGARCVLVLRPREAMDLHELLISNQLTKATARTALHLMWAMGSAAKRSPGTWKRLRNLIPEAQQYLDQVTSVTT